MQYKNKTIGRKIKTHRESKKLTQRELAEFVNLDYQAISRIELGKQIIKAEDLFDIAGVLGVCIYDFGTMNN